MGRSVSMNKAKKLYGIMTLALALSLANTVPVKAVAVDEAFAGVVSASKNTTSTALADAELYSLRERKRLSDQQNV